MDSGQATEQMKADLAALKKWTSVLDDNARLKAEYDTYQKASLYDGKEFENLDANELAKVRSTAEKEMYARGFEAYLREGRTPSAKLDSVFSRFRKWLVRVYRNVLSLNVELSDEVREVFDRMLVTEDEVDLAAAAANIRTETRNMADRLNVKGEE